MITYLVLGNMRQRLNKSKENIIYQTTTQTKVKDLSKIEIYIGNFLVFKDNQINKNYVENKVKKYLKNDNVDITIKYNGGKESATVWTTDLTYEYIKINAEYRT